MTHLIDRIAADRIAAAKSGLAARRILLSTLHAEAARVGKDKRNDKSTDEEVLQTIVKFRKNAEEALAACEKAGASKATQADALRAEMEILGEYLPAQMSRDDLRAAIAGIVAGLSVRDPKAMGQVMSALKTAHGGSYDGKMASELVREALT